MPPEVNQEWLEARFHAIEQKIEGIMTRVFDVTSPLKEGLDRLRGDIDQLYTRQREADSDINILKADKSDKQNNTGTVVAIIAVISAVAVSVIGFVL
jgi:hypothetical protein